MLSNVMAELFARDLNRVKQEIALYSDEALLWSLKGDISNSPGNLCLHIIGNLNHFIGAVLGGSDYVRHRDREFNDKNVPRFEMLTAVDATILMVNNVLKKLTAEQLEQDYPIELFGKPMTTSWFLIHLHSHLNYHLGQINYHRRLIQA